MNYRVGPPILGRGPHLGTISMDLAIFQQMSSYYFIMTILYFILQILVLEN